MNWKWIVVLFLLLILVIFVTQNYEVVEIKFLLWSFKTSRAIIVFLALLGGILIGWITTIMRKNKRKKNE